MIRTGLKALPDGLHVEGGLYLNGCTGLKALPDGLHVEGNMIWLWLDDLRVPPVPYTHWIGRSGPQSFMPFVLRYAGAIEAISFDNNLGDDQLEGRDLMFQLRTLVEAGTLRLPRLQLINVHTADSAAAPAIVADAERVCDYVTRRFSEELGPRAVTYKIVGKIVG